MPKTNQATLGAYKRLAHQLNLGIPLPDDFTAWTTHNQTGWTIAHLAAIHNLLPKNFTHWNIADKKGQTVAHAAANFGNLPPNFNLWNLTANNGQTVWQAHQKRLELEQINQVEQQFHVEHIIYLDQIDSLYNK